MSKAPTNGLKGPRSDSTENEIKGAHVAPKHGAGSEGTSSTGSSLVDQEVYIRRKKYRNTKRKKRIRLAIIIASAIVVLILAIGAAVVFAIQSGNAALHQEATDVQVSEEADSSDAGKTVSYNGHTYQLNENIVSLCVMGYDRDAQTGEGQAGQADAIMVLAIDTESGKVTAIGIPRDSMVPVDVFAGESYLGQQTQQICLQYGYGDGEGQSAQLTTDTVSRVLYNMPMSYYFALNMQGIVALNDAIGGVSLTPIQSIPGTDIVKGKPAFLYGQDALKYVQWRDTSVDGSSLDRQARQVQYVQEFTSDALAVAKGDVGMFLNLYNTLGDYSVTNLGINEYSYLISTLLNKNLSSVDVVTLDGTMDTSGEYNKFYLDSTSVYETVLSVYYNQID